MKRLILICIIYLFSVSLFSQWQQTDLANFRIEALTADVSAVFASTESGNYTSLYKSTDQGESWSIVLGNKHYYSLTMNGPNIFAGVAGGVWKSTDYGTTWVQAGLVNFNIYSLALKDTIVFAGTADKGALPVYKSVNNGVTWINSGWGCPDGAVTSLYVNGDYIYAGYLDFGIYVNNINGGSWSAFNTGLPNTDYPYVGAITSTGNIVFGGTEVGVYRSTDGEPWKAANNGLPITIVRDFAKTGNILFAGTNQGVFMTADTGNSWMPFSDGLPANMIVLSLTISGNWLFAGSGSGSYGLWRRNIDTLVSVNEMAPSPCIYPNPGNGTFMLRFGNHLKWYEVYDIKGNKVVTGAVDPQSSPIQLDFSFLKPGVYLIRLNTDHTIISRKIIIL